MEEGRRAFTASNKDGRMLCLGLRETLNNYLRCQGYVKNRLKMLIYYQ